MIYRHVCKGRNVSICRLAILGFLAASATAFAQDPLENPNGGVNWDLNALSKAPAIFPSTEVKEDGVEAIFYEGLLYQGKPTRVFAWLGRPQLAAGEKAPAMVLIHGGGGTAFANWVRLWNARGYVAISMDTCGQLPIGDKDRPRPELAGPMGWGDFEHIDSPIGDQWGYHAVADVILANSLLRSLPEVDSDRIGVTGISWGGYLTCISASIDNRFRFAAPVYGCGYLGEASCWIPTFEKMAPEKAQKWLQLWDPSVYLPRAKEPFLWVTGTNDSCYHLGPYQKSYRLQTGPRTICMRVRMPHAHEPGFNCEEIYAFADTLLKGVPAFTAVTDQGRDGQSVWAQYAPPVTVKSAELNFTRDATAPWPDRNWETLPATIDATAKRVQATLPEDAKLYYFNLTDERNWLVSSEHIDLSAEPSK